MANILTINDRDWLVGMTWASFDNAPNKNELKEDAARLKSDWYSLRVGDSVIQAGFCEPVDDLKYPRKTSSLAAMLADSKEQPWLGIFKIGEKLWWYIAVRDGNAILPNGDIVGGEAEIRAAQEMHSGYTDWKYVEGDLEFLAELINEIDAKPTTVKSLTSSPLPIVPIIATATVLLLLASGGYYYYHQKQVAEEIARVAAMKKMRDAMASNKPIVAAIPSPLLTSPEPDKWLSACSTIILNLPLSSYGWAFDQVSCGQTAVTVNWLRKEGATVAKKPDGVLDIDGEKITQTIPLTDLTQEGVDDSIALDKAQLQMRAWSQAINVPLTLTQPAPPPVPLPGAAPAPAAVLPTPQSNLTLALTTSPFKLHFNVIPGLRLTKLESTANGWSLEGILYGK